MITPSLLGINKKVFKKNGIYRTVAIEKTTTKSFTILPGHTAELKVLNCIIISYVREFDKMYKFD